MKRGIEVGGVGLFPSQFERALIKRRRPPSIFRVSIIKLEINTVAVNEESARVCDLRSLPIIGITTGDVDIFMMKYFIDVHHLPSFQ